jgi:hypothetical protein
MLENLWKRQPGKHLMHMLSGKAISVLKDFRAERMP